VVSYSHIEHLALDNGQTLLAARLLPVSVDGAVLVASLVLADYARRGAQAPPLGRILLTAGILITLAANGISGASHGPVGVMVAMLPAGAFIGSVELLLAMVKSSSQTAPASKDSQALLDSSPAPQGVSPQAPASTPAARTRSPLPANRPTSRGMSPEPAEIFRAELERGEVPSFRVVKTRCHVGQPAAKAIRAELAGLVSARGATIEVTS
jgi:hypothetical protein